MFLLSKILSNFTPKLNKLHLTTTYVQNSLNCVTQKKFGGACSRTLLAIMDARRTFRRGGGKPKKRPTP